MLTCRRTLQIQLQLNPRQGSVNDCDLAVLTFTAHAELEATCASGISETKHSTRGLVDQSVSPCSHFRATFGQSSQLQATKAANSAQDSGYDSSPLAIPSPASSLPFLVSISMGWQGSVTAEPPCSVSCSGSCSTLVALPLVSDSVGSAAKPRSANCCSRRAMRSSSSALGVTRCSEFASCEIAPAERGLSFFNRTSRIASARMFLRSTAVNGSAPGGSGSWCRFFLPPACPRSRAFSVWLCKQQRPARPAGPRHDAPVLVIASHVCMLSPRCLAWRSLIIDCYIATIRIWLEISSCTRSHCTVSR